MCDDETQRGERQEATNLPIFSNMTRFFSDRPITSDMPAMIRSCAPPSSAVSDQAQIPFECVMCLWARLYRV